MTFYKAIIENSSCALGADGVFVFEIGASLDGMITSLAKAHGFEAEITPDVSGLPRMAVLRHNKQNET